MQPMKMAVLIILRSYWQRFRRNRRKEDSTMMIRKGMFIGDRYEIVDKVGSGGMSDVYKALDHKLNRYVAVKVLKDEFSEDKSFVSKFKVEAQSAAGLTHPNIVNVYDVGEEEGIYYIVMELVEGITLKKYIEKKGKLSVKESVSIAIQVAQGIEAAHNNHIIHRDIKPQNVIISREGKVKVTDFGIARAASANTINSNAMGSVHYISPEQARGGYIDEKSDIYSLGISLYEMITGKVPFQGDSTVTIALQHINEELPSPKLEVSDLPISVEKIIEKCTQKKAERRYLKVSTLIADLKKALVTPDEDFVVMQPSANTDATIMITDEQISVIRNGASVAASSTAAAIGDDIDVSLTSSAKKIKDEPFGDDDDIDATNPKLDKIVTIGAIVASVVVLIVMVLILINVLKGCDGDAENPYESTTQPQTGLSSTETMVPDVVNRTLSEAEELLNKAKLGIRVEYEHSNDVAEGLVIRQDKKAESIVDKHSTVTVYISEGAEEFVVPSVDKMKREEAVKMLEEQYGLVVTVEYEANKDIEIDTCIRTSPTAPTKLKYGDHITLYVSEAEDNELVELPEMVNKTKEQVKSELEALGLTVAFKEEYHATIEAGKVISAEFKAGTSIPKNEVVDIVVSKGVEETTEPPTKPVEKVTKTEVTIKGFDDSMFDLPSISVTVNGEVSTKPEETENNGENSEDSGEGSNGEGNNPVQPREPETVMQKVTSGKLTASLIVKHDNKTTTSDVTKNIVSEYTTGYTQRQFSILIDELGVTDVTFMLTLSYTDSDGKTKETVVYRENHCVNSEVVVEVTE